MAEIMTKAEYDVLVALWWTELPTFPLRANCRSDKVLNSLCDKMWIHRYEEGMIALTKRGLDALHRMPKGWEHWYDPVFVLSPEHHAAPE